MGEFLIQNGKLTEYKGKEDIVKIPDGVVEIDALTFHDCNMIKTVICPSSLKKIGKNAFAFCKNLQKISLPDGIEVGYGAFRFCKKLQYISDGESIVLNNVDEYSFDTCSKLETKIIIDSGIKAIGMSAFADCKNIKYVNLPERVALKSFAFLGCERLESISDSGKIVLLEVGESAFSFCKNLKTSIFIDDSVNSIGENAFYNCKKIEEIHIPTKAKQNIKVQSKVVQEKKEAKVQSVFVIENNVLKEYNGNSETVYIPEQVTEIGEEAFAWNNSIISVYLNNKVVKIGKAAFMQCENLKRITLPNKIEIGKNAFENCISLETITNDARYILGETGEGAFDNCEKLKNDIEISEGITELKDRIFAYSQEIRKVYIPDSLKKIGENCFGDVEEFICKGNVDMFLELQSQGYECSITEENPYHIDEKEENRLLQNLNSTKENQLPEWESVFPEEPFTVEEQWLYGIHPDDETYKKLLELEVLRKFRNKRR